MPLPEHVVRGALLVGLAALIPLPFVDELVRRWVLSRLFCSLTADLETPLTQRQGWRLARRPFLSILGCLLTLVWFPIKKLFRTLVYVLILKDAVDWVADALVRCALVHRSAHRGALPVATEAIWAPLDKTVSASLQSPITRWLRGRKTPPETPLGRLVPPGSLAAWVLQWADAGTVLHAFEPELDALMADVPDSQTASGPLGSGLASS